MLTDGERQMMRDLNERIQNEPDPMKLIKLVEQLNALLERAEMRVKVLRQGQG
jgi:hypothetical protein